MGRNERFPTDKRTATQYMATAYKRTPLLMKGTNEAGEPCTYEAEYHGDGWWSTSRVRPPLGPSELKEAIRHLLQQHRDGRLPLETAELVVAELVDHSSRLRAITPDERKELQEWYRQTKQEVLPDG